MRSSTRWSTRNIQVHRQRRGLALLAALGLLLLLAIMTTAWIATTRADRSSTILHTSNTQVDLLMDGLWNTAQAAIAADLFDPATKAYRPAGSLNSPVNYNHWTCATADSTLNAGGLLSERTPTIVQGAVHWPAISAPLHADTFADPTRPRGQETYTERTDVLPDFATFNDQLYPALNVNGRNYVAADADGDGIADAGLWPLNVGQSNGITWYAAARIIDNSAAINASVAWKPNDDYLAALPGNFFPTNIDLQTLLTSGSDVAALDAFRFGRGRPSLAPVSDAGRTASGFSFSTPYEALWTQLGRRLADPGLDTPTLRYRPLSDSDNAMLARSRAPSPNGAATTLNTLIPQTLSAGLGSTPFAPSQVSAWAAQRYDFDAGNYARQPLLVASNPTSTAIQAHQQTGKLASLFNAPYPANPGKTSINTASFEVLWRTFWNVMCDSSQKTIFGDAGADVFNPYSEDNPQRMFRSPIRDIRFNDPARFDASTIRMDPFQVLLMRSALAAVNAIDLRDADQDVTSRHFLLTAKVDGQDQPVDVTVFGTAQQPFITEVFAHTDTLTPGGNQNRPNPRGYVAIELHNPYPNPISLRNWNLGLMDRHPGRSSFSLRPLAGFQGFAGDVVVPARGYLVLENYKADASGSAAYRPRSSGLPANGAAGRRNARFLYVPGLADVIEGQGSAGGELVLLRPRRADGTLSSGDGYNESNLNDLVPVDQFDFTGLRYPSNPPAYTIWHYSRASGDAHAWQFVYPGKYDGTKPGQRQEGTDVTQVLDPKGEPSAPIANLGEYDPGTYVNPYPPIQLANMNPANAPTSTFPYGGFARVGDLLHTPFIGSYRIRPAGSSGHFLEMNSVTMDTVFADDADKADDNQEAVGRFVPIVGAGLASAQRKPHSPIDWRVYTAADDGCSKTFENMEISPPVNTKGLCVGCDESVGWVPRQLTLRNLDIHDVYRDGYGASLGLHLDCIQVHLDGDNQRIKTDVLIENVYCHDTNVESCNLQDGRFGLIHINNLRLKNAKSAKIYVMNSGSIDKILIENSPGLSIIVQGRRYIHPDGTETYTGDHVGPIVVKNSPGAIVKGDGLNVTYINDQASVPQISADDYGTDPAAWRYHFAMKLFDYFTVLGAQEDSYPLNSSLTGGAVAAATPGRTTSSPADQAFPMQGQVNINTAPWPVLAAVPMLPDPKDNAELAKAIVAYRTARGPFTSLFELNQVVSGDDPTKGFRNGWGKLDFSQDFTANQGDLSPSDSVTSDWEQTEMMVNRVSNLLSTRSDSFTVYLVIQGWRNANTPQAQLVTQRRAAWIVDRSQVTASNKTLRTVSVPMN